MTKRLPPEYYYDDDGHPSKSTTELRQTEQVLEKYYLAHLERHPRRKYDHLTIILSEMAYIFEALGCLKHLTLFTVKRI